MSEDRTRDPRDSIAIEDLFDRYGDHLAERHPRDVEAGLEWLVTSLKADPPVGFVTEDKPEAPQANPRRLPQEHHLGESTPAQQREVPTEVIVFDGTQTAVVGRQPTSAPMLITSAIALTTLVVSAMAALLWIIVGTGYISVMLALKCAAVSAATTFAVATFELQQTIRKTMRWPWLSKGERQGKVGYPTFGLWVFANLVLRPSVIAVLGGVLGAVGWIADPRAAIVLGLTSAVTLGRIIAPTVSQPLASGPVDVEVATAEAARKAL